MKVKEKVAIRLIRARLNLLAVVSPEKAAKKAFNLFCTPQRRTGKKRTAIMKKGEKLSFRLNGHSIRGHRWTQAPMPLNQTPVPSGQLPAPSKRILIVHGFLSNAGNFGAYVETFVRKGYEVLAFDAPAHGLSGGKRITIPLYVEMIRTICEKYGPVHRFMGHSFGGLSLALYLESAFAKPAGPATQSVPPGEEAKLVLIAPMCDTVSAVDGFFNLLGLSQTIRQETDRYEESLFGKPFSWYSIRRAFHQLSTPTLWVQDEEDSITPLKDALLVKDDGHPNIQFVFTKGLGHRKIYRDEKIMQEIADFL